MLSKEEIEIIEKLKKCLVYDAPPLSQLRFDSIVDYIINNSAIYTNPKELIWRLCGCYEGLNFNKVIDLFVDSKDSFYTSELVCFVNGNLDQKYLVKKMIETNDLKYINNAMSSCGNAMLSFLESANVDILKKYCDSKRSMYESKK